MGASFKPMRTRSVVRRCSARELVWNGRVAHRWILSAEHRFAWALPTDAALEDALTEWTHSERFGGLCGWLFVLLFGRTVRRTFERMNVCLKELAEEKYIAEVRAATVES